MDPIDMAGAVAAVTGAAAGVVWIGRGALRWGRRIAHMVDDLTGEPARPGVPARPGLMERIGTIEGRLDGLDGRLDGLDARLGCLDGRLAAVEHELRPNSGSSLHDKVTRLAEAVAPER
ncbi:hypothetical protein [Micromonospora sp. HM5-17]|uniref:hypothetical protein n=1 Tax=Micromonospora sp. HM5-17 TaxID=2487710 RepID=UPI003518E111